MATITRTPQEELRSLAIEAQTLHEAGPLEGQNATKMGDLIIRMQGLRTHIEQGDQLGDIVGFAGKSSGMLPMVAPANTRASVVGMANAGSSTFGTETEYFDATLRNGEIARYGRTKMAELQDAYGEGIFAVKTLQNTETPEYRDAFRTYVRHGINNVKSSGLKVLQESVDPSGGFLVPLDILERVISKEPTPTRVAGRVTQLQTSRDALIIPRVNYTTDDLYTTGMRVTWTGEIPASSTAMRVTEPLFGQSHIPVYTAMMSVPITNDMIEDSAFPLVSWITGKFAETIDLLRDNMVLNGSGIGQPSGILLNPGDAAGTQPAVFKTGTSASLGTDGGVVGQNLANLAFSLPEQYDTNACFVMNKTSTANSIASQIDGNKRLLWGAGYQDSGYAANLRDRSLLGYPVVYSGFVPSLAALSFPVIFGDLTGYYLVNRIGFSVQVLRELYAETNQILVLGRIRFGGQMAESWKVKILQASA